MGHECVVLIAFRAMRTCETWKHVARCSGQQQDGFLMTVNEPHLHHGGVVSHIRCLSEMRSVMVWSNFQCNDNNSDAWSITSEIIQMHCDVQLAPLLPLQVGP